MANHALGTICGGRYKAYAFVTLVMPGPCQAGRWLKQYLVQE